MLRLIINKFLQVSSLSFSAVLYFGEGISGGIFMGQ